MSTKFDIYVCITITGLIPLLTLSVPDQGSSRKASWALHLISTFVLLSLGRYLCWLWAYLMKVLPERRREHSIWYLRLFCYHWVDTSADFEHTWWRFFQKGVMSTKFDIYVCITITGSIPLLTLSVPDEGSSRKAAWALHLISTFVLLSLGWYLCWLWAYLMKVLPERRREH
jgi:ABC-type nickel/cobalt efflux system permease component RcnA